VRRLAVPHAELIDKITAAQDTITLESFAAIKTLAAKIQGTKNPPI